MPLGCLEIPAVLIFGVLRAAVLGDVPVFDFGVFELLDNAVLLLLGGDLALWVGVGLIAQRCS